MSRFLSMRKGEIRDVDNDLAEKLIADGVAEEYTLIEPTGKITITENGNDIDVAQYAKADVNVAGGQSDFTTAEVTVHNLSGESILLFCPNCIDLEEPPMSGLLNVAHAEPGDTIIKIAMYKGLASLEWGAIENVTATGGITVDSDETATVVGDGTITFPAGA